VDYTVAPDPKTSSFMVSIQIDHPGPNESFSIPGWSPGYYVMQRYEREISHVTAEQNGQTDTITQPDSRSWTVATTGAAPLVVSYRVAGDDVGLGFFGASVKGDEAYYNGPSTYLYVAGRRNESCSLHLKPPATWRVATALDPDGSDGWTAPNYDALADYPVQMGHFAVRKFTESGIPFKAVFVTPPGEQTSFDIDAQMSVISKVSDPAIEMFGGAPFKRYLYIFHLNGVGFQGGLEHRSGTVIAIPNAPGDDISDLVAHEEFHAWNVKQIRPKLLGPFDYTSPQRTGALWFAEGVTDYYAKILTYRSGVHNAGWLLDQLTDQVGTLQGGQTRLTKTVEDASRAVWEDGGFDLGDLDYYNKGLLAGLIFDSEIRKATHGEKSLDDVMRLMFREYRLPNPGYDEDGILRAINEVAGVDMTPLYDSVIRGTGELPYVDLRAIGLDLATPSRNGIASYEVKQDPNASREAANLRSEWLERPPLEIGSVSSESAGK
jgi:predicted metalloprotease with PDZ domain